MEQPPVGVGDLMGVMQAARAGKADLHREPGRERHGAQAVLRGLHVHAVHVLHRQPRRAVRPPEVEDLHDVPMRQHGRQASLALEPRDDIWILRQVGQRALDRDQLAEPGLALQGRQVDLAHAALRASWQFCAHEASRRILPGRTPWTVEVAEGDLILRLATRSGDTGAHARQRHRSLRWRSAASWQWST